MPVILMKSVRQLVLLGDPQQLLPTVNNNSAGTLGLCRSLLHRYIDSAASLNEQYRMVSVGVVDLGGRAGRGSLDADLYTVAVL